MLCLESLRAAVVGQEAVWIAESADWRDKSKAWKRRKHSNEQLKTRIWTHDNWRWGLRDDIWSVYATHNSLRSIYIWFCPFFLVLNIFHNSLGHRDYSHIVFNKMQSKKKKLHPIALWIKFATIKVFLDCFTLPVLFVWLSLHEHGLSSAAHTCHNSNNAKATGWTQCVWKYLETLWLD